MGFESVHFERRRSDLEELDLEELLFFGHGAVGCVVAPVYSGRGPAECVRVVGGGQEGELSLAAGGRCAAEAAQQ
jgi:hypothetical protein